MGIRFYCEIDGFQDNWIEVGTVWTRKDEKQLLGVFDLDPYFDLMHTKAEACHIVLPDGTIVNDVSELSEEGLGDDIDLRLWGFIVGVLFSVREHLRSLGNLSARLSSSGAGKAQTPAKK